MNPLLASLPLVGLLVAMTVTSRRLRLPLPAHVALPAAAGVALLLQMLTGTDVSAALIGARVIEGLLTALMPLAIVFGAIVLFATLKASGAMATITEQLERASPDPLPRVMLIAWAFAYLVEGLSGFGTPAALAAPLLVGMGFPPVRAAAACLVMNTVPVVFGAVGTPMWFGLGELGLEAGELRSISVRAAVLQCVAAPVVAMLALRMLFPWCEIRGRLMMILAVVVATVVPAGVVAMSSAEFPSIVGGLTGMAAAFAAGRLAARVDPSHTPGGAQAARLPLWRAVFPLAATVLILAATRIEPLGLRAALNAASPAATVDLGGMGSLSVSAVLVVRLDEILGTPIAWTMPLLYVPFILPFLAVSMLAIPVLGLTTGRAARAWADSARRLTLAAAALGGALVFVKLMMHGGDAAPVVAIGRGLADAVAAVHGPLWLGVAPAMGVVGSFFSGSATVSNLTFGPVQAEIAGRLGLDLTLVLALQSVGAAIGNMVCIHNIIAVAAVLGLTRVAAAEDPAVTDVPAPPGDPVAAILRLNLRPLIVLLIVCACSGLVLALV